MPEKIDAVGLSLHQALNMLSISQNSLEHSELIAPPFTLNDLQNITIKQLKLLRILSLEQLLITENLQPDLIIPK